MLKERVCFSGVDLSSRFTVSDVVRPLPAREYVKADIPGVDGTCITGNTLSEQVVNMNLWAYGKPRRELRGALRELAGLLGKREPGKLAFSDDGGRYYLAYPSVSGVDEYLDSLCVSVEFTIPDPVLYGAERVVAIPSGGFVTFRVGGTHPTRPVITAEAAVRSASSLVWGVRLDDGDFLHVATGGASARKVELNCAERTCHVAGAVALPTLDSDWMSLEPGTHTLAIDNGTGGATVTYRERWL